MLEKALPISKQFAFLCQTKADEERFRTEFRTNGLKATLYTLENKVDDGKLYSQKNLSDMSDMGVQGYLMDSIGIECPQIVRNFLVQWCSMGNVLWARTEAHGGMTKERFERLKARGKDGKPVGFHLYIY